MSLIKAENLTFSYPGSFDLIFENAGFQIDTDWKLGFIGRNGKGKTTFLNLLLGKYPYSGVIQAHVGFSYFPFTVENPEDLAFDVAREIAPQAEDWQILRELFLLSVAEDVLYQPFSTLSQGEQTKLMLAALFLRKNEFLLIDEPTNHLDDGARTTLCGYLNRKKGFILVSHDRHFLDGCVDHILAINRANIQVQKEISPPGIRIRPGRTALRPPGMRSSKSPSGSWRPPRSNAPAGLTRWKRPSLTPRIPACGWTGAMWAIRRRK